MEGDINCTDIPFIHRNNDFGKMHFINSVNDFVVSIVGVFTCSFIFKIGKVSGNQDAFSVPVPLSLILISLIQAGKLHSMT